MLSIGAMSGGQAGYYLGLAREDYYTQGGEPPGVWLGAGAETLGLTGIVDPIHLHNLFGGNSPSGDRSLVQTQRHQGKQTHRPGWDLTFSAPKSVSTLWSQADPEFRRLIQDAHFESVKSALAFVEESLSASRRGRGGTMVERCRLVIATFEHSTSRALDPSIHTHCLALNIGIRQDGSSGTLSSLPIFQSKMTVGALYRAEFSTRLQDLGLSIRRTRSWFEVDGVAKELTTLFSKRRASIEADLERKGVRSARAAAAAALETREAKEAKSRQNLFQEWRSHGQALGWSTPEANRLIKPDIKRDVVAKDVSLCAQSACRKLDESQAHFCERDLLRFSAEEAQGRGFRVKDIVEGVRQYLTAAPDIVRLGTTANEPRYATQNMMELEKSLLSTTGSLAMRTGHAVPTEPAMTVLSKHRELSEEQMKAVWHLTVESGDIAVVSGMAGTGKTRMLSAARESWQSSGFKVQGAALAARAARELESGSEIPSQTIAKLLHDLSSGRAVLDERTVLVVDEAGMIATPDMNRLAAACHSSNAKLVLIGDERQLQPIGPGAPFEFLGSRHGKAELVEIRRQNEPWARRAVKDIADGKARKALREIAQRGFLSVHDSKPDAIDALLDRWKSSSVPLTDKLILASTRAEVAELNRRAQDQRQASEVLGAESVELNEDRIFPADRVMFTKNSRARGIDNGMRGTVVTVDPTANTISVQLDSGRCVSVCVDEFPHVALGYAGTVHKAQGATSQATFVLAGGPMQDREISYVQSSRARQETWYFSTRERAGDEIARLAREMERSRQKSMAHSLTERPWPQRPSIDR